MEECKFLGIELIKDFNFFILNWVIKWFCKRSNGINSVVFIKVCYNKVGVELNVFIIFFLYSFIFGVYLEL